LSALKAVVWSYNGSASPINTAIAKSNTALALALLEMGHKPEIDFKTWLQAAKIGGCTNLGNSHDDHVNRYHGSVSQPLLDAIVKCPEPALIKSLLDAGADPNWLPEQAWSKVSNEYMRKDPYYVAETALDIVKVQIKGLRKFAPEKKPRTGRRPHPPKGTDEFAVKFAEGTYSRYVVDRKIRDKQQTYKNELKRYRRDKRDNGKLDETCFINKDNAVQQLLADFEKIEQMLIEAGAKGFHELHPDIAKGKKWRNPYGRHSRFRSGPQTYGDENKEPFEYKFGFSGADDFGGIRHEAYVNM